MTEQVKLTKAGLLSDKEAGLTTEEMAVKYNLPVTQMRKALKIAGINMRAKAKDKFVFTDDTTTSPVLTDAMNGIKESFVA